MVDDTGAAGGPRGHGGPGLGGPSNFCRGFSSSLKGRGRGRGCGCGPGRGACRGTAKDKEWIPVTKLGRLVKDMKIKSLEAIYLFSLPISKSEIIDFFLGASLKDEVLKIMPVQKQTWTVTGRCGSVLVRLIPDPRRTGIVSAPVPKKLLMMPGVDDCYTSARATFNAISKTYRYLTSDLWKETVFTKSPYQEFTDHLVKTHTSVSVQRNQAPAVAII
uniref:Small ribosomal subunit protein uS5 n=1 Tax=Peromyscus maniculatus bairdii TaxID=230844 RepID=A0A8C8UFI1_PERMB